MSLNRRKSWTTIGTLLFVGVTMFPSERAWSQSAVFTFGPDVPIDQRQTIQDAITLGHQFFQTRLGVTVQRTTNVFAFADPERLVDAYLAFRNLPPASRSWVWEKFMNCGTGEAGFDYLFICAGGDGWNNPVSPAGADLRSRRTKMVLHEYVHVLQFDLVGSQFGCCGSDDVPSIGPAWLIEGTAEYLTWVFFGDNDVVDFDAVIESQRNSSRHVGALGGFETYGGLFSVPFAQSLGEVAVDILVAFTSLPDLVSFWSDIGSGATWQEAFESAFGRTIDEFYVEFEEIRSRNFVLIDPANLMPILQMLFEED